MSQRAIHLSEQFRKVLSKSIVFQMRDPGLEGVTITRVKVTEDLQFADIRFTLADGQHLGQALSSLNRAKGALRNILAKSIRMKKAPQLRFHFDKDIAAERRIEDILATLEIPKHEPNET